MSEVAAAVIGAMFGTTVGSLICVLFVIWWNRR